MLVLEPTSDSNDGTVRLAKTARFSPSAWSARVRSVGARHRIPRDERLGSQQPVGGSYHGYRFPPDIISHAVWLYHRFCLSFRDAEDLLAQRGVTVTYETIRADL